MVMIAKSSKMKQVLEEIERYAPESDHVLITGETGVGKQLVAEKLQESSTRAEKPFVIFNSAGFTPELADSQLFGHVKGAFTGASTDKDKEGLFEQAHGGTLFLDEIGELDLNVVQAKLLRILETGKFHRVGGVDELGPFNVRVIAATNRNLVEAIRNKEFRPDLFYRFTYEIYVPPLRKRQKDLEALIDKFLEQFSQERCKKIRGISPEARQFLRDFSWPGNVRQLENIIKRVVVNTTDGTEIGLPEIMKQLDNPVERELENFTESPEPPPSSSQSTDSPASVRDPVERELENFTESPEPPPSSSQSADPPASVRTPPAQGMFDPTQGLFDLPVALFCKVLVLNRQYLTREALIRWMDTIPDPAHVVVPAQSEIDSWHPEDIVNPLKSAVDESVSVLSKALELPNPPTPIDITNKSMPAILNAVLDFFTEEFKYVGGDEEVAVEEAAVEEAAVKKAAAKLGLTLKKFEEEKERNQKSIAGLEKKRQKEESEKKDTNKPKAIEGLKPPPYDEVEKLLETDVSDFLGYPMKTKTFERLDSTEMLQTARLALSVLGARLAGKHGTICIGGLTYNDIREEIYDRSRFLYENTLTNLGNALGPDKRTIEDELRALQLFDLLNDPPTAHTLFK